MKLRTITYYIQEAFISLIRNRLMALASIITVISCIFIVSFSYCVAINIDYILEQMERSSLKLSVYVDDSLDASQVSPLADKIEAIPNVKSVKYISAEDALDTFREELKADEDLLVSLEQDNPLPRTFVISLDDAKNQTIVLDELKKLEGQGISKVKYDKDIVNIITTLNTGIRVVSIIVIACLIIISIIIIMNTIKITVNSRRTEIVIMKYVGATDWFIRWPFIIEGMIIGIIGAIIPVGICMLGYSKATVAVFEQFKMLENLFVFKSSSAIFMVMVPLCLAIGMGIGTIGSVTSLRKYLKA